MTTTTLALLTHAIPPPDAGTHPSLAMTEMLARPTLAALLLDASTHPTHLAMTTTLARLTPVTRPLDAGTLLWCAMTTAPAPRISAVSLLVDSACTRPSLAMTPMLALLTRATPPLDAGTHPLLAMTAASARLIRATQALDAPTHPLLLAMTTSGAPLTHVTPLQDASTLLSNARSPLTLALSTSALRPREDARQYLSSAMITILAQLTRATLLQDVCTHPSPAILQLPVKSGHAARLLDVVHSTVT